MKHEADLITVVLVRIRPTRFESEMLPKEIRPENKILIKKLRVNENKEKKESKINTDIWKSYFDTNMGSNEVNLD